MSDLLGEDFTDGEVIPPAALNVDPAAAFLASEQSDLAQIEQTVYDEVPQISEDIFDPFSVPATVVATEEEPVEDLGFIESASIVQATPVDLDFGEPIELISAPEPVEEVEEICPPVQSVFTMPKMEPEIIKQWRDDFKIRCDEIEANADEEKLQWQSTAKEQLDKFYADRAEKLEKNKSLNRENADALRVDQEQFNPAEGKDDAKKWEMVTQRIDFNAKGSCTKDTTRMRQVLLQLKAGSTD